MSKDTEVIKSKIDIINFISEYVDLSPAGKNHKALCPFHNENTPSFMVNKERQMWHCFGCGKGGDIFTFIEEMEDMEFIEALKFLADRAGVELSNDLENKTNKSQKNRIKGINEAAANFFHNFLTQMGSAQPAREYLKGRGLNQETINYWQLGFIPDQWDLLTQYLLKQGFAIEDLVAAGVTKEKEDKTNRSSDRGYYDRFRGRIMFPIRNVYGNIVGFTGRILDEDQDFVGGKYINTPDTPVYDKSEVVFGLSKAKQTARQQDELILVEGQMDVIMCHQENMDNVVAVSGTSLTKKQIQKMQRYTDNLKIAFDNDDAGVEAAKRGIRIAMNEGMHVNIVDIPEDVGEDPDECIKNNSDTWYEIVENAEDIMSWYFKRAFEDKNLDNPKEKQQIVNELLPEISSISYAVERDHWLQKLATRVGVDEDVLRDDMKRIQDEKNFYSENNQQNNQDKKVADENKEATRFEKLVKNFLGLFFRFPDIELSFPVEINQSEGLSNILKVYQTSSKLLANDVFTLTNLKNKLNRDQDNLVDVTLMASEKSDPDISRRDAKKQLQDLSNKIEQEWIKLKRKKLQQQIKQAEEAGDNEKANKLLEQFNNLSAI
jgi:DNA primase